MYPGGFILRITILLFSLTLMVGGLALDVQGEGDKYARAREARRLLKDAIAHLESGENQRCLEVIDSVLATDPSNADGFYYRGLALVRSADTAGAIAALVEGTQAAPMSSIIKLLLVRLHLSVGELDAAAGHLDAVLAIKPRHGEALYLSGMVALSRGDSTQAIDKFEQSLQMAVDRKDK